MFFVVAFRVNLIVMQEKSVDQKTRETSGQTAFGLFDFLDPIGVYLRTSVESSLLSLGRYVKNWKQKTMKSGRWYLELETSGQGIDDGEFGLLPTPMASDYKGGLRGGALEKRLGMKRGVCLEEHLLRGMLPTPTSGNCHGAGRLDEWGGKNKFRGTELGKLHLTPSFVEEMMGFPVGWTELQDYGPWETQSSRTVQNSSAER